jgi:hypothetical protein
MIPEHFRVTRPIWDRQGGLIDLVKPAQARSPPEEPGDKGLALEQLEGAGPL